MYPEVGVRRRSESELRHLASEQAKRQFDSLEERRRRSYLMRLLAKAGDPVLQPFDWQLDELIQRGYQIPPAWQALVSDIK